MPTWNRREFVPAAIDCFLRQTYENRELVILDDGDDSIADLVPSDPKIRYFREEKRRVTGDKRNRANELAKGQIICHWDDDDWSAPERVERQVKILLASKRLVTGYGTLYFWHTIRQQAMVYTARIHGYICGTTFCYHRLFWQQKKFRSHQEGSDNNFIYPRLGEIAQTKDADMMVARIHACHHTSRKSSITRVVPRETIPARFWANEELRCRASAS